MGGRGKPLTEQQQNFCRWYARTENPKEAALLAGFAAGVAEGEALQLLENSAVRKEIARQRKLQQENLRQRVLVGLERLAFGGSADALELVLQEEPQGLNLDRLDLYRVSGVKRSSSGIELRLYDRQKALETLWQLTSEEAAPLCGLYKALDQAAAKQPSVKQAEGADADGQEE